LELQTQQRIQNAVCRLGADVADALGSECRDYDEIVAYVWPVLQKWGNCSLSTLLLEIARAVLPDGDTDVTLKAEDFGLYLAQMDTREKLEALLLALPEPDPKSLDATLHAIRILLPAMRQALLPFARRLPHPPGGRPRKLADPERREAIRMEIGVFLAKGVTLKDAQRRIADREQVSLGIVQQIWRDRQKNKQPMIE
jgi:hypothetical protein